MLESRGATLLFQWIERLTAFSSFPRDAIGMIGGGRRKPKGQVDVALIRSLVRKGEVDDIVGRTGWCSAPHNKHVPSGWKAALGLLFFRGRLGWRPLSFG